MAERTRQGGGFRGLKVVDKVRESRIITSFHLQPVDADGWRPFEAGQFLVLRIPEDGDRRAVPRSYSVSSAPGRQGHYRITLKREAAPGPGVPDGVGSCWLHDRIKVGDVLQASGPRGEFFLNRASPRPVVLLSGGVGLTPLVSMLHALKTQTHRPVQFIHACDNGEVHALRDEVAFLARQRPGVGVHYCYRFPTEHDRATAAHQSEGVLTADLLARLLPQEADVYMCGPPPFMKAVYGILRGRGVPKERIAYEFFGPASVLETDVAAADTQRHVLTVPVDIPSLRDLSSATPPPPADTPRAAETAVTVEFRRSGRKLAWDATAPSLLEFAEAIGIAPEFQCRAGVCSTCRTRLISGAVAYTEEPLDPPGPEHALICCSKPKGSVVLDL